jgi:hypothetical protein
LINEKILPTSDFDQTLIFNIYGRYVRVYPSPTVGDGYFALSQVVVNNAAGVNIAQGKTATAVSDYSGVRPASIAVDGTLTPRLWPTLWNNNNVGRATDYWQVDLGSLEMITAVRVITRPDMPIGAWPDRNKGLRVVVLQTPTEVSNPKGTCIAMPTPIYPPGVSPNAVEKAVIDPMILDGYNPTIALNIYRGLSSNPSSFVTYGLTDSQSADAIVRIRIANLNARRAAGNMNDNDLFSQVNDVKRIKTMAAISGFDVSSEVRQYMSANIKTTATVDPVSKAVTKIEDGGKEATMKAIMSVLKQDGVDPSAGFSQTTTANANVAIPAAPDTGTWAKSVLKNLPIQATTITIPTSGGQTTITSSMTPEQKAAATKANNPNALLLTPNMSQEERAAAIAAANASQNVSNGGTRPLSQAQMDAASQTTSGDRGFSSPTMSQAAGGQGQWYMRLTSVSVGDAAQRCTEYGGRLATLEQIQNAQTKGASVSDYGWYAGVTNTVAYPHSSGTKTTTPSRSTYYVNCYGPKSPQGTSDVAPWTDRAITYPGGASYTVNDWSQRIGGDGGVAKNADGALSNPGTPLKTQEVYYVGGTQSLNREQSMTLCKNLGGTLATDGHKNAAQAAGAKWCGAGWLSDSDPRQTATGCPNPSVNGATCIGIKPSTDSVTSNKATVPSSMSPVSFPLEVVPFSTAGTVISWSQTGMDTAESCRPGQTFRTCKINGVDTPTCVNNGDTSCAQGCPAGSTEAIKPDGTMGCDTGSRVQPNCAGGSTVTNCGTSDRPNYACLTSSQTCSSVQNNQGPDSARAIVIPDDADKPKFTAIANRWLKVTSKYCDQGRHSDGSCIKRDGYIDSHYFYSYTAQNDGTGDPEIVILPVGYTKDTEECSVNKVDGIANGFNPEQCRIACVWGGVPVLQTVFFGYYRGATYNQPATKTFQPGSDYYTYSKCRQDQIGIDPLCKIQTVQIYTCPMNPPTKNTETKKVSRDQFVYLYTSARYIRITCSPSIGSDGYMNISQVIVQDINRNNIARGKPVFVTSNWGGDNKQVIVDGTTTPRSFNSGGVWHNGSNNVQPGRVAGRDYCQIDLGSNQYVTIVRIIGRAGDCGGLGDICDRRMKGMVVSAYTQAEGPNQGYAGETQSAAATAARQQFEAQTQSIHAEMQAAAARGDSQAMYNAMERLTQL